MDTWNLFQLIKKIYNYEPNLFEIIFDYVFVPCRGDSKGKHKFIRAMSALGTNIILRLDLTDIVPLHSSFLSGSVPCRLH